MVRFACPSCGDEHDLFPGADLDDALDYPVLARLPFDPDLRSFDGDRPDSLDSLVQTVSERLTTEDDLTVPEDAVDVRDLPEHGRIEAVVDAAAGLDPGDTLTVVSDRHPADLAVALVDALGVDGSPSEVFPTYEVTASDPDEWILRVRPPADATLSST